MFLMFVDSSDVEQIGLQLSLKVSSVISGRSLWTVEQQEDCVVARYSLTVAVVCASVLCAV